MNAIAERIQNIQSQLPASTTLVAVSKTKPVSAIMKAYESGHRDFGENKVQELTAKAEEMPKDIKWHMIGHLQRNKVKYIAPFVYLIHGVDSFRLLKEINKEGKKNDRIIACLLQVHIADEESKFGFDEQELVEMLKSNEFDQLENVKILGLMGMATFTENKDQIRDEFKSLKSLFDKLKTFDSGNIEMNILSMGMSGDYHIAIEEGSTMVRVGSAIFAARNY
ncbi:MAG: YggS family pyridoxal phosphate-dependent enzyme [Ekhidna sp.]